MLKVLLVDDEENVREALKTILEDYCTGVSLAGTCSTVLSAVEAIKEHKPDVLLLDIEIGKERGFDIFEHFTNPAFKVIFITAYQQYAVQAFRFAALDYLLKPVDPALLAKALNKASDLIDKEKLSLKINSFIHNYTTSDKATKKIVLKTSDNIHVVNLGEIVYCQADRSYTFFYLEDGSRIIVSNTLGNYEELLAEYDFIRIHQSYLVNLDYIRRFEKGDGGMLALKTGVSLPVASRKKEQLLQRLAQL